MGMWMSQSVMQALPTYLEILVRRVRCSETPSSSKINKSWRIGYATDDVNQRNSAFQLDDKLIISYRKAVRLEPRSVR